MLTRRETMIAGTAAAILAGIGIQPAHAEPAPDTTAIDRELHLALSDGFTRQAWRYGGQTWVETRDVLTLHEDEVIRITITNDRPGSRVISLGSERDLIMLRAGETKSVTLTIRQLQGFRVSVMGEPMITRAATVRPNYGAHANVI
jgi:hypothetical protein